MSEVDDPLWDPKAKPDHDLARLERILSPLGARARGVVMPSLHDRLPRGARGLGWALAAGIAAILMVGGFQYRLGWRNGASWPVTHGSFGTAANASLAPGQEVTTKSGQTLRIQVARIGSISLSPHSRLVLEQTQTGRHRVRLDKGHMRARIWAPPGYFGVNAGKAEIVDLGCDFDVWSQPGDVVRIRVRSGWISYQVGSHDILVAEGHEMSLRGQEVGTPLRIGASNAFMQAVKELDAEVDSRNPDVVALAAIVAESASDQDALTLLSLLTRRPYLAGTAIYPRLAKALHVPDDVRGHREAWQRGNTAAINAWWDRLPRQPKRWLANWTDVLP